MLSKRLLFGTLMTVAFAGLCVLDAWWDGSLWPSHLTAGPSDDKLMRGTGLAALVVLVVVLGQFELASLAAARGLDVFLAATIPASILTALTWYLAQIPRFDATLYLALVLVGGFTGSLLCQYLRHGTTQVMANWGMNCLAMLYLGLFAGFVVAVRVEFGVWPLLMYVFTVKCSDIGAYAIGSLFGRHGFSPRVSPKKTWEGLAGGIAAAVLTALAFGVGFGIMTALGATLFGVIFAILGQAGDLAESMIKRDAQQKDSAAKVPGFGGILDVIDSALFTAPFAYLFLGCCRC